MSDTAEESDGLVQRLVAIEEIKQLKARYFRAMDQKEWDDFGQVFARDAVLEVPEANMVEHGREAIVASVSGALIAARTVHHGHMPEIEVTGADSARGTWAMADLVEWPATDDGERVGIQGYGHYVEEYVREDGRWKISRSRLVRLRVDGLSAAQLELG